MYNFETICRTCSCEGELQSLFIEDPLKISDMLIETTELKVLEGDNFPQNICINCLEKLKIAHLFKKQCLDVNLKFQEYLNNIHVKDEVLINAVKQENYYENNFDIELDLSSSSPDVSLKSRKHKKVIHKCEVCDKQFTLRSKYHRHIKIHSNERPHVCVICGRGFVQKSNLNSHMRIHSTETPFSCTDCDKSFKQKHQLLNHVRLKHSDESKFANGFECKICNKTYARRGSLYKHIATHKENKYLCNYCGKSFSQSYYLTTHKLIHTGEKPYKCSFCDKTFRHKFTCRVHELIHTGVKPHKCDLCEQGFREKAHLVKHRMIHTGDKPYKCNICEQSFRQQSHLKYHSFTHSGEKPFKCVNCDKSFTMKSNLTVHLKTHR